MDQKNIIEYIREKYPSDSRSDDLEFLDKINALIPINTWADVAEAISALEEIGSREVPPLISMLKEKKISTWEEFAKIREVSKKKMSVAKSSTWAICQELLGNLSGADLWYAQGRGGIWSILVDPVVKGISTREMFEDLQKKYPC